MTKEYFANIRLIELIYLFGSVLMFFWSLFLLEYTPYAHGPDLYVLLFMVVNFGFIVIGVALTVSAWRSIRTDEGSSRKSIAWMLTVATLLAISYFAIPLLSRYVCRPDYVVFENPMPPAPNAIERIWKHCF